MLLYVLCPFLHCTPTDAKKEAPCSSFAVPLGNAIPADSVQDWFLLKNYDGVVILHNDEQRACLLSLTHDGDNVDDGEV